MSKLLEKFSRFLGFPDKWISEEDILASLDTQRWKTIVDVRHAIKSLHGEENNSEGFIASRLKIADRMINLILEVLERQGKIEVKNCGEVSEEEIANSMSQSVRNTKIMNGVIKLTPPMSNVYRKLS